MKNQGVKILAQNRKARYQYEILESIEAGIVLEGTEVKSIRQGHVNFRDSYARIQHQEVWLCGLDIPPYDHGNQFNHQSDRQRKLLLHRTEIRRLQARLQQDGLTLVPLSIYLKDSLVKVELALARGKKLYDKRESLKRKSSEMEMKRHLR